ncbi:MAG: lamin tail domain-containing protein [Saprospiraceae bacterium]|nr:lamin tail domain-containing protein [Saprospiraceae bacterium]
MTRFVFTVILFCSGIACAFSQITDDFSDGDITQNPAWQGDVTHFEVDTSGALQLVAPAAGSSVLAVQGAIPDSAVWTLDFLLLFAPSNNNLLRIYLLADQANLPVANGYFLEIGETGSLDALRLFRQDAGAKTLLATGQPGLVATGPTDIHLKVKRSSAGVWSVEAATPDSPLQPQFTVPDATFGGGADRFFGVQCVYTGNNVNKFYFDNLSILPDVPDTQAPVLLSAVAPDAGSVKVVFGEDLDSVSAVTPANYSISNGIGQPASAGLLPDKRSVLLTLQNSLATGNYTLQTSGVQDLSGNESAVQTADFTYLKIDAATEFDLLINEIMASPTPVAGLPPAEWLELYNRSSKTIDLSTLSIQDAVGSPVALPSKIIFPDEYVVVTATGNVAALQAVVPGTVIGLPISTIYLNNEGDVLTLSDAGGNLIDRVAYDVQWHTDPDKDGGGWSLERINPNAPCVGAPNWRSCTLLIGGGTPGKQNAAYQNTPDTTLPRLLAAYPESTTSVVLTFSEGLDKSIAETPALYHLAPSRTVSAAHQLSDDRAQIRLTLNEPLQINTLYVVTVETTLTDCAGNAVPASDTALLGLSEKPEPQDIVVNEIMFNPATGNARYVELYNRSNKIFNWAEFTLANFSAGTSLAPITWKRLVLPGQYDVFTEFPNNVRNTFDHIHRENVLENDLPSLDVNEGNITLYWSKNGQYVVVDSFDYSADLHNALLSSGDREGVALERIDANLPTNTAYNWTSASPAVTGAPGTPTLPNSQRHHAAASDDTWIFLPVERISPDDDAMEDYLDIRYELPQAGFAAAVTIFSSDGVPVKRLVRQELLGTEGALRWDGDLDDGTRAKPGIYVLFTELYSDSGETRRIKKAFAVVGRF